MTKRTKEIVETELQDERKRNIELRNERDRLRTLTDERQKQFDDLKTRLQTAESENQRMRGYIQRVQEDDTVREELIAVGDPQGEQRMVPKRKPTTFETPSDYSELNRPNGMYYERDRPKPRHWITY